MRPDRVVMWVLAVLALAILGTPGLAAEGLRRVILTPNADYPGFDLRTLKEVSLEDCQTACLADRSCLAFTYNTKARWCFLKNGAGLLRQASNATAGKIFETPPKPAIEAAPALTFLAPETVSASESYARSLRDALPSPYADPAALASNLDRAVVAKDFRGAAELARQLVAFEPYRAGLWRTLAEALGSAAGIDANRRAEFNADSISAAIEAYMLAPSREERAQALALLAQGLERAEDFRKTLEAYKAALAQARLREVEQAYDAALAKYGFRVVDYTVDADATSPRICLQFSDPIGPAPNAYESFVRIDDREPDGVDVREKELCIDGAKHGVRHAVTVREGLPSIYSEILEKPVTLSVYVRDRQPSVRFTGRNYVLPSAGRQAIPIVSVNTEEIGLELYHIDRRGLSAVVRGSEFLSQLTGYDARNLAEDKGRLLWSGSLGVAKTRNEDVTTSIPLEEVLKERRPCRRAW
jgi:alpha-2-macroglobulin